MSNMADEFNEQTALVPVREAQVEFYGNSLAAAQLADGTILVPVRPLCEYLGLTWSGQFERLKQNPVLSEALQFVRVTRTNAWRPQYALSTTQVPSGLALRHPGQPCQARSPRQDPPLPARML